MRSSFPICTLSLFRPPFYLFLRYLRSAAERVSSNIGIRPLFETWWLHGGPYLYTGYTQKNGAVSKLNKKFISHLTRPQSTPSAVATVQVSHALPAVRFSCLLRGQFPRWRRSRKRLSVCSVLRCPDLWLQCSMSFVYSLEKTHYAWCVFSKPCTKLTLHCNHRSGHLKTEHTESLFLLRRHLWNWTRCPAVSMRSELLVAHEKLGQLPLLTVYVVPV